MKIASRIIDLRTKAGLTRYALSQACGVPQSQLADYETGRATPKIATLSKITDVLGCTLSEFFNNEHSILYLSQDEITHIHQYRTLTFSQKEAVERIIEELLSKS